MTQSELVDGSRLVQRNVFVAGDLVIDHDIFVRRTQPPHVAGETSYDVVRRQDAAGGAANSARLLAVVNEGRTILWGVMGASPWGSFRSILSNSQILDGASPPIELRGVADESASPMNTVTHLVEQGDDRLLHRVTRFADVNHLHVTEDKRGSVKYFLERAHARPKGPLHVVVVNDCGFGCLRSETVRDIAVFCQAEHIALVLDPTIEPHSEGHAKYDGIAGTVFMPNFDEWHWLVRPRQPASYYRQRLKDPVMMSEMAQLTLERFPGFMYHVIKCDRDGALLLVPSQTTPEDYQVILREPEPVGERIVEDQIGCGDVMTAMIAAHIEYDSTPPAFLKAFDNANHVVARYRERPFHHMPSRQLLTSTSSMRPRARRLSPPPQSIAVGDGALLRAALSRLPRDFTGQPSAEWETGIPNLRSRNSKFRAAVDSFIGELQSGGSNIALGAQGGSGKSSTILPAICGAWGRNHGIHAVAYTAKEAIKQATDEVLIAEAQRLRREAGQSAQAFIIIDEAVKYGRPDLTTNLTVKLLNRLAEPDLRVGLLLIDTAFMDALEQVRYPERAPDKAMIDSECRRRFVRHALPHLRERRDDLLVLVLEAMGPDPRREALVAALIEAERKMVNNSDTTPHEILSCARAAHVASASVCIPSVLKQQVPSQAIPY